MSTITTPPSAPEDDVDAIRRHAAVQKAASVTDPQALTEQEAQDATDWFTSAEVETEGFHDFELNVSNGKPKWVKFRVGALPRERITEIRKQNTITILEGDREVKVPDETAINTRIAAEGLLNPDLKDPKNRTVRGEQFMDPAAALAARFAHKPGLIDQITGETIDVSGYNDGDKREVRAGKS